MRKVMLLILAFVLSGAFLQAAIYRIDPDHSGVNFRVAHLAVSKVSGRFEKFEGTINYEPKKPQSWSVEAAIVSSSLNTNLAGRDDHLRSADFLDAEKYPAITFKSSKVTGMKKNKAKLHGDLTLHGVTKAVILDLIIGGVIKDPWGNQKLGATATITINRKDFGLTWNKALEAGGVLVGEEVEITLEMEAAAEKG